MVGEAEMSNCGMRGTNNSGAVAAVDTSAAEEEARRKEHKASVHVLAKRLPVEVAGEGEK